MVAIKNATATDNVGILQPVLKRVAGGYSSMLLFALPAVQVCSSQAGSRRMPKDSEDVMEVFRVEGSVEGSEAGTGGFGLVCPVFRVGKAVVDVMNGVNVQKLCSILAECRTSYHTLCIQHIHKFLCIYKNIAFCAATKM